MIFEVWKMRMLSVLLMVGILAGSVFAGVTVPDWDVSQDSFRSGASGVITMTVTNSGEYRMSSIGMTIRSPPEITITGPGTIVDLGVGGSTTVALPFKVKADAASGIYLVEVRFAGFEVVPGGDKVAVSSVAVPITVVDEPELTLTVDKQVVSGIDEVTLTIENQGGLAKNLRVRVGDSSEVAMLGTNELFVNELAGETSLAMVLDSRDADDGPLDLPVMLSYEDELGISHEETNYIRMTVKKERLDLTFVQESALITREEGTLTLTVTNGGSEALEDVRISFEDSNIRLKGRNEIAFGNVPAGGSSTQSAAVIADYTPGLNRVAATVMWVDENVEKTESASIPLTITSDAEVGVYLEAKPAPLTVGTEHTISVLVSNLGSYGIDNVEVSIESEALQMLDISADRYIGSLQNDDFSTVQFKAKVISAEPGEYPLDVSVTYRDKSGEWKTANLERSIEVYSPVAQGGVDPVLCIPVLAAGAGAVWYFKLRKKK